MGWKPMPRSGRAHELNRIRMRGLDPASRGGMSTLAWTCSARSSVPACAGAGTAPLVGRGGVPGPLLAAVGEDERQKNRNLQHGDHWIHFSTPNACPFRIQKARNGGTVTGFIGRSTRIGLCVRGVGLWIGVSLGLISLASENNSGFHSAIKSGILRKDSN
jgi:hypothetical protein